MTNNIENPETVCETVKRVMRDELCKELSFIRPEVAENIADAVCNKISMILDEKIAASSLEGVEDSFYEASKKLGW